MSTPAHDLIQCWEPHDHVALRLQVVDSTTATFDIAVAPAYRGAGLGSAALADLTQLADELGVALRIQAEPDPEMCSPQRLAEWYAGFGFEPTGPCRRGAIPMYRPIEPH